MARNNIVTLIGNLGSEAKIIEKEGKTFAAVSLATKDSYQDEAGEWQEKDTVWHNILAFGPKVVQELKSYKKGTRLEITGTLSYRPFQVTTEDGKTITKSEATVIASQVKQAPLPKKSAA